MPVFRVQKSKNYTVMSNYHLKDKNISFKAKGMLSFMLSLPDDWDYSLNGLCSVSKEGLGSIRAIINELKENKYLQIRKYRTDGGVFEYEYLIFERPQLCKGAYVDPELKKHWENSKNSESNQCMKTSYGKPVSGEPHMDYEMQINTKELITKKKKEDRKKRAVYEYEVEALRNQEKWNELYDNDNNE